MATQLCIAGDWTQSSAGHPDLTPDEHQFNEMVECYLDSVNPLPKRHFAVYAFSEFEQLEGAAIRKRLQLPMGTVPGAALLMLSSHDHEEDI